MRLFLLEFLSVKTSHSTVNHLHLILRLKWRILRLLVLFLLNRNLRSHSYLLDGIFCKLVIIGSRRVAAVRRVLVGGFLVHVDFENKVIIVISSLILALGRFLAQSLVRFILVKQRVKLITSSCRLNFSRACGLCYLTMSVLLTFGGTVLVQSKVRLFKACMRVSLRILCCIVVLLRNWNSLRCKVLTRNWLIRRIECEMFRHPIMCIECRVCIIYFEHVLLLALIY